MDGLKKLKKKYPSKNKTKTEKNTIVDNIEKNTIVDNIEIDKTDISNNIIIIRKKYNNLNQLLENNIHIYSEKLEKINKDLKITQELRNEKEIFLKEFSDNKYKQKFDKFIFLQNEVLEKENQLEREKNIINELNKNIDNYLIDLDKTEELLRKDSGFFL